MYDSNGYLSSLFMHENSILLSFNFYTRIHSKCGQLPTTTLNKDGSVKSNEFHGMMYVLELLYYVELPYNVRIARVHTLFIFYFFFIDFLLSVVFFSTVQGECAIFSLFFFFFSSSFSLFYLSNKI